MIMRKILGLIFICCTITGCDLYDPSNPKPHKMVVPERPVSVPSSASWTGYIDGGMWYDCKAKVKSYECITYTETGDLIDKGNYSVSFKSDPNVCKQIIVNEKLIFSGSNYGIIILENDFDLKADGVIDSPPSGHSGVGMKQRFECGKEVGDKEQYSPLS